MNNENDKFLDDLISYYDSEDDLGGSTTVIPAVKSDIAPDEELMGDTLIVRVKPNESNESDISEEGHTTVINAVHEDEPVREIPQDEVLGGLDIDSLSAPLPRRQVRDVAPPPVNKRAYEHEDAPVVKKTGIWYTLKPLWATMIVCAMLVCSYLFYITDTGIIGIYKSNFSYNFSLIMRVFGIDYNPSGELPIIGSLVTVAHAEGEDSTYKDIDEKKATIPFPGADTADFECYDKGVVCVKSNYICYIDKSGKKKWEHDTQISNPILSAAGEYIAVAGKESTYLNLYKGKKLVYAIEVDDKIRSCSVSEKGDVALVTDKTAYKGAVSVFNKKGEEVFSWVSGVNFIVSASMLKSRNVAVSLVSAETLVKSFVMVFDIYETDPINGVEIADSLVFDSNAIKNNAFVTSDNTIASVNDDGEANYIIRFDNMELTHTAIDTKGWRAVSYTDGYLPYMSIYDKDGDFYASAPTESIPDHIDVYKSVVVYNNGHDIMCGKIDDTKTRYSAPMTVKKLIMINKSTYMIVYENSLELIKI